MDLGVTRNREKTKTRILKKFEKTIINKKDKSMTDLGGERSRQIDELPMPAGRLVPRLNIEELKATLSNYWGTKVPGLIVCHARYVFKKACHGKQDSPITMLRQSLTLSYSSKINDYLYHQRVSPPLKKTP